MGGLFSRLLAPLAAVWLAGGLLACGGGGANTTTVTSSAASAAATPPSTTTHTTTHTPTAAQPPASAPSSPSSHPATPHGSAATHVSGAAAHFLVKGGDNSIPEYGQEASTSERARAAAVLATFLRARAQGEWSRVCASLTATTRAQLERLVKAARGKAGALQGCGGVLAALSRGPAAARADPLAGGVAALRIKGTAAFALFYGPHASKYVVPMRREGGAWKVSQIAPLPYPLGTPGVAP